MTEGRATRAMVIGLDSAEPSLIDAWRDELLTLSRLMHSGVHGRLTSVIPPIAAAGAGVGARGRLDAHLLDVAPTVPELLGLDFAETRGRSLAAELAG